MLDQAQFLGAARHPMPATLAQAPRRLRLLPWAVTAAALALAGAPAPAAASCAAPRTSSYSSLITSTAGLVGYWRLGEASTSCPAADSSGAAPGHTGSYTGGVTVPLTPGAIAGDPDTAAGFDGSSGYVSVNVPPAAPLNVGDRFTVEAWVKRSSTNSSPGSFAVIASKQNAGSAATAAWVLAFEADRLVLRQSSVANVASSATTLTDTSGWHHVAATKDGPVTRLYIDGADVTGVVSDQTMADNGQPLLIGATATSNAGFNSFYPGSIDEFALYSSALSASQIAARFTAGSGRTLDPVIGAAGDIACDPADPSFSSGSGAATLCHQVFTSSLLTSGGLAALLTLGDDQYQESSAAGSSLSAFQSAFGPSWGRMSDVIAPAPGNHEYRNPFGRAGNAIDAQNGDVAAGYFDYFNGVGAQDGPAGARDAGYYSYDVGTWHLIALNSNCAAGAPLSCASGSPQEQWLAADLAAHHNQCLLAYWHHPLFASAPQEGAPTTYMHDIWQDLHNAGADVVLNGHVHYYERFASQDASGAAAANGPREFIVGTGGRSLKEPPVTPGANSQLVHYQSFGVLRLTLHSGGYDWHFQPEPQTAASTGAGVTDTLIDSGAASCHNSYAAGPAVTLTSPASGATVSTSTPTLAGSAGTASGDGATVSVKIYAGSMVRGTPLQTVSVARAGGGWSTASRPLSPGTYTALAEQPNPSAGVTGHSVPVTFTLTTPPPPAVAPPAPVVPPGLPPGLPPPVPPIFPPPAGSALRCVLSALPVQPRLATAGVLNASLTCDRPATASGGARLILRARAHARGSSGRLGRRAGARSAREMVLRLAPTAVAANRVAGLTLTLSATDRRAVGALLRSGNGAAATFRVTAVAAGGRQTTGTSVAVLARAPAHPGRSPTLRGVNLPVILAEQSNATIDNQLALASHLGANLVRIPVRWRLLEPGARGAPDPAYLAALDHLFAAASVFRLRVLIALDSTPCWASSAPAALRQGCGGAGDAARIGAYPPTRADDFGAVAGFLAGRYGGDLTALEVWNEPDNQGLGSLVGPDRASRYADMLRSAYAAVKGASPDTAVLGASVVQARGSFLADLYRHGIKGHFDGLAVHAFGLVLASVRALHQIQLRAGDRSPMWLTSFGWSTCTPARSTGPCVSRGQQAIDAPDVLGVLGRSSFLRAAVVKGLEDENPEHFGLLDDSRDAKPAFSTVRAMMAGQAVPTPVSLRLRRRGAAVRASGSGPAGDDLELDVYRGRRLRLRRLIRLDAANRYVVSFPRSLARRGMRVRVSQFWSGAAATAHL